MEQSKARFGDEILTRDDSLSLMSLLPEATAVR